MTRKRDAYQSAFDAGKPGVTAASYDLMLALYLLESYLKDHDLLRERVEFRRDGSRSLAQLLEIAKDAQKLSIDPALRIYERLQENKEAAEALSETSIYADEWTAVHDALTQTLSNKAVARRGLVSAARRMIARQDAEDARTAAEVAE